MKKVLFFLFAVICTQNEVSAQRGREAINNALGSLQDLTGQMGRLDKSISENIYGNVSAQTIRTYDDRLKTATKIVGELEDVDKVFVKAMTEFPNEKDYVYYDVLTKLTMLRITYNAADYISYLALDKENEKKYGDIKDAWERKSSESVKAVKTEIALLQQQMNANNEYTETLNAICLYYDNKEGAAITKLQTITRGLKDKIDAEKNDLAENAFREQEQSFALTWLSYLYYTSAQNDAAIAIFRQVKDSIIQPDNDCALWSDEACKQMVTAKCKTEDMKVCPFNMPGNNTFSEVKTLLYEKKSLNGSSYAGFNLVDSQAQTITGQKELIDETKRNWEELSAIENTPIALFIDRMRSSDGKMKKADYKAVFQKMTSKNKGGGDENLDRYRVRFDKAYAVLQRFIYLRQCWTNIIHDNPDVPFFRLYRAKADLGITYLNQNSQSFVAFFDYYKIKGDKINSNDLNRIKDDFATSADNEMKSDLDFCTTKGPDNVIYKLAKLEVQILTGGDPGAALTAIDMLQDQIPATTTIDETDPRSILELYRSYVYLKMGDADKLRKCVQPLNTFQNTAYWANRVKDYQYYFDNINQVK